MVGLRYEVGGDWNAYERIFSFAGLAELERVLRLGDPAYQLLNWFVQRLEVDIWLVNLVCGLIFSWGLLRLAKTQPDPWLAVLVAIPYLVVVVAMGYSRQAVAIGILMAGLSTLQRRGSVLRFTVYVVMAALFHKTAVVVLPLVAFASRRGVLINFLVGVAATVLLYDLLVSESIDRLMRNYIQAPQSSQGAAIRIAMSVIPAALFFLRRRNFSFVGDEYRLWRNFSLAAFAFLVLLILLPYSTVVDRLALYVLPLQVVILSRLPGTFGSPGIGRLTIVLYSAAVLFVWLNFAVHADAWIPYQVYPLW